MPAGSATPNSPRYRSACQRSRYANFLVRHSYLFLMTIGRNAGRIPKTEGFGRSATLHGSSLGYVSRMVWWPVLTGTSLGISTLAPKTTLKQCCSRVAGARVTGEWPIFKASARRTIRTSRRCKNATH